MGWLSLLLLVLLVYGVGIFLWIRYAKKVFDNLLDRGASVAKRQNTFVIHALCVLIGHIGFMLLSFLLISQVNAEYAIRQAHIDGFASAGFIGLFILVPILFVFFRKPYLRYVR